MAVAALLLAGCGESSSDSNEAAGTYRVKVTEASFPTEQRLGQTSLLQLGIRNSGKKTLPALTVTVTIAGKAGAGSSLPFAIHDPTAGLAQSERPVWVLAQTYPRLAGSSQPGGATTSNRKTFAFGPLKPGETTSAVWKLSAVRAGKYTLLYRVGAGLGDEVKAVTGKGVAPGGSFVAEITSELPETEVLDNGEVVEIKRGKRSSE
ncbi:MAG TPA: hypothetical protein VMT37_08125 [Solirubrobacterales bacterium]|nr:hypothetical protein [Solirubrobacterales bacterium]